MAHKDGLRARLIRGSIGTAGIHAANRLLVLAFGILLARTLGAAGYGVYTFAIAIMLVLMVVAKAGVPTLLMREISTSYSQEDWGLLRGALRRAIQFVSFVAICVSAVGLLVLSSQANTLNAEMLYTIGLMFLTLPALALSDTVVHALMALHRVVTGNAILFVIRPLLLLALVGGGFLLWPDLRVPQYAMAAQLIAVLLVLATGVFFLRRCLPWQSRAVTPVYRNRLWLKTTLPFTLTEAAAIINIETGIIMLGWLANAETVGIYRVAMQGGLLVAFGLQAITAVVAPRFARLNEQSDMATLQKVLTYSSRASFFIALPLALALILAGEPILVWVFGPEFAAAQVPLAILSCGYLVHAAFGPVGVVLNMAGHERLVSRIVWLTALLTIVLNAVLIPFFGAAGAATATALSVLIWKSLLYYHAKKQLRLSCNPFTWQPT